MSVAVTTHAKKRLKECCGINKQSALRMAEKAFKEGISFDNAGELLQKYISSVYLKHDKMCNNLRIYGNTVYVFDNQTLITVYPIPENIQNEMESYATSIDEAADKAYFTHKILQNTLKPKRLDQDSALKVAQDIFANETHKPYKYSVKNDHIGKYILLSFETPFFAKKYEHLICKVSEATGYRVEVNKHTNTALLQTEFLKLFLKNGVEIVKPASFTSDVIATIYINKYEPICEHLKQEIFETYGVIVNFSY